MTTHRLKRCNHCQSRYYYQASGNGCFQPLNDSNYCAECKAIIIQALESIPVKRTSKWIDDNEDPNVLLNVYDEFRKNNPNGFERVSLGLYNTQTGESEQSRHIRYNNINYVVSWWESTVKETGYKVKKEVEINTITNEIIGPWKDIN